MSEMLHHLQTMLHEGRVAEVSNLIEIAACDKSIGDADLHYLRGKVYMKQQRWGDAISAFLKAEAIDPQSPAREARCMLDNILCFYHKDSYNP